MDALFSKFKGFIKKPPTTIDNFIFRLHYRVTFSLLLALSLMVTSKQYFGDPIDCISKDDIPLKLLDTYCWIHTTFSIKSAWRKNVGSEVPYPGVDKSSPDGQDRVYHAYYQWVCFILFFQGLAFYVPRLIWKQYEGGKIEKLAKGLNDPMSEEVNVNKIKLVIKYLRTYESRHNSLYYVYTLMEFLNFFNVLFQMYIMNRFLGGEFTTYGWDVINFADWDWNLRYDPMIKVFPRITKCTFHRFGTSGDVQKHDAMCILPINILNEKIYIFLWFWFYGLAIVTFVAILYRLITFVSSQIRVSRTAKHAHFDDKYELEDFISRNKIGDWFVWDMLSRNMDHASFRELVSQYQISDDEKA